MLDRPSTTWFKQNNPINHASVPTNHASMVAAVANTLLFPLFSSPIFSIGPVTLFPSWDCRFLNSQLLRQFPGLGSCLVSRVSYLVCCVSYLFLLRHDRIRLDFDLGVGVDEPGDLDDGGGGADFAEGFAVDGRHLFPF